MQVDNRQTDGWLDRQTDRYGVVTTLERRP